jgi:MscS family membrane protein
MESVSTFLHERVGIEPWVASLVAIAVLTVVANLVGQVLLRQAARVTRRTSTVWDDALVRSAGSPMLLALAVIGLGFMARVLQTRFGVQFIGEALAVRDVALIACVAWFLVRFAGRVGEGVVANHVARQEEIDRTTVDALVKLARLLVVIVALVTAAHTLGFEVTGLLAVGGMGGLAVGFAAKDLLANFFGGLTIYLDRPFSVGDWIRSPDKEIEGTVEVISWRHTRIRAFNKNPLYVPNAVFTTIVVENPSRMSHRRIKETIGLRYDDFSVVDRVVEDIRAMLRSHPGIDAGQTLIVNFNQFGASSLDLMVYTFTKTVVWVDYHEVKQDVLLQIGRIIEQHGAEIAFPTQTLHLPGVEGAAPERPARDADARRPPPAERTAARPAASAPASQGRGASRPETPADHTLAGHGADDGEG